MSLDDDFPAISPVPTDTTPAHVLLAKVDDATRDLHRRGLRESARKSYAQGVAFRIAANDVRRAAGLPVLDYDRGVAEWTR